MADFSYKLIIKDDFMMIFYRNKEDEALLICIIIDLADKKKNIKKKINIMRHKVENEMKDTLIESFEQLNFFL